MGIAFGDQAANRRDGRALLDLSVRLAARLYPHLTLLASSAGDQCVGDMMNLAKAINPNIEVRRTGTPDVVLAVGADAPSVDLPTVYAGCDGWQGFVGIDHRYATSDTGNPFGAGFAACLAAANLFRFLFLPDGKNLLDDDACFPPDFKSFPCLTETTLSDPLVLVGAGAVGNGAAWALSRTPLIGRLYLVDPETVELSNLQRYVLCERSDEDGIKVEILGEEFGDQLRPLAHQGTWTSFVAANGYRWERVLVALDSASDRRAVQGSLPRWIANAWTQHGDFGVSVHGFLPPDACLACLYLPTRESKSEDQIIAEGLKIPELQDQVRVLLGSGRGASKEICDAVAGAWGIPVDALTPYLGRPIRELWVEGVCGGGIIPLEETGPVPRELEVPLAFQSAFAGVLLAAEATRDALAADVQRTTQVRRLDILRPLSDPLPQPALKARTGNCICEDSDFVSAYRTKYALQSQPALF